MPLVPPVIRAILFFNVFIANRLLLTNRSDCIDCYRITTGGNPVKEFFCDR
jgi:hypothetical protein